LTEDERLAAVVSGLTKTKIVALLKGLGVAFPKKGPGSKVDELSERLLGYLRSSADGRASFLDQIDTEVKTTFLKGYCRNEHVVAQNVGFMKLADWFTKEKKMPAFIHFIWYDNAPSHWKRAEDALHVHSLPKKDGYTGPSRRPTVFPPGHARAGQVQRLVLDDGVTNKGLQAVGFERGYWHADGKPFTDVYWPKNDDGAPVPANKALNLDHMCARLELDADFKSCPTILQETMAAFEPTSASSFEMDYLSKFWCILAPVEQYWNDCKRVTRQQCDYTITGLKAVFPVALATAVPGTQNRKYLQRSLDQAEALRNIGRHGDFSAVPSLCREYKSHRLAHLMRLGLASEEHRRQRSAWGSVEHARRLPAVAEGGEDDSAGDEDGSPSAGLAPALAPVLAPAAAAPAAAPAGEDMLDLEEEPLPETAHRACAAAMAGAAAELEDQEPHADEEQPPLVVGAGRFSARGRIKPARYR